MKKILSMILAIVMVASMLPVGIAFAADGDITYDFLAAVEKAAAASDEVTGGWAAGGNTNTYFDSNPNLAQFMPEGISVNTTVGSGVTNTVGEYLWQKNLGLRINNLWSDWSTNSLWDRNRFALDLEISDAQAGWYRPNVKFYASGFPGNVTIAVYMISGSDAKYLGELTSASNGADLNPVELSAGTHTLLFGVCSGPAGGLVMYFENITLKKLDSVPSLVDFEATFTEKLKMGAKGTVSAGAMTMSDGGSFTFATYGAAVTGACTGTDTTSTADYVKVESSDTSVATVERVDANKWSINPAKEGTATITATPVFNGVELGDLAEEQTVTVVGGDITYDFIASAAAAKAAGEAFTNGKSNQYFEQDGSNLASYMPAGITVNSVIGVPYSTVGIHFWQENRGLFISNSERGWTNPVYDWQRNRLAFDIEISEAKAGWYRPSVKINGIQSSHQYSVYVISGSDVKYLGELTSASNGAALNPVELSAGKHTLLLGVHADPATNNARENLHTYIESIKLTKLSSAPTMKTFKAEIPAEIILGSAQVEISASATTLTDDDSFTFATYGAAATGGCTGLDTASTDNYILVESSDTSVATVERVGANTWSINPIEEGETEITVTPYFNGVAQEALKQTKTSTVIRPGAPRVFEYVLSFDGMNSAKMILDSNLTESGENFGNTPVIRAANTSVYFKDMLNWTYEVPAKYSKDGSPFMALDTTEGDGDAKLTDKWAYVYGRPGTGLSSMYIDARSFRAQFRPDEYGRRANYVVFKIHADAPGEYILQAKALADSSGAAPAVYFFKEGAAGVAIDNPATYPAGSKREYFNSSKNSDYNFVGNVEIDEVGSYIVAFALDEESAEINPATSTNNMGIPFQWFMLSGLRLVPENLDFCKKLEVKAETDMIYIGETLNLDISEVWEYAGNKDISYSDVVIEVSGDCIEVSNGVVTAISEGEAVITVTKKDTPEITGEFKIEVYDPDAENIGKRLEYIIATKVMKDQTSYNPHNNRLDQNGVLRDLTYVDSYDEIDGEKTELWAYNTRSNISWLNFEINGMHVTPAPADYAKGSFFAMKLRVPVKGTYDVNIEMEPSVIGTEADIYMFPKGDITTVLLSDLEGKTPIGHIDSTRFDEPVQTAGNFTVDRGGEFYIVFKFDSDNPNVHQDSHRHSMQFKRIELAAPTGPFETVDVNIETLDGEGDELYFNAYRKVEITPCDAFGNPIEGVDPDYFKPEVSLTKGDDIARLVYENGNYYVETGETAGECELAINVTYRDKNVSTVFPFVVADVGKTGRTIYSDEMIEAARENIKKYDWAKSERVSAVRAADKYLEVGIDTLWNHVTSQDIPRSVYVAFSNDPDKDYYSCRYCGKNLYADYGLYPFTVDMIRSPWKIKCPECSRSFPSNDFGKFYELGRTRDNEGKFDRITALENHRTMLIANGLLSDEAVKMTSPGKEYSNDWYTYYGYGVKGGYLYNELYPEVADENCPVDFDPSTETVERWGVDDGLGYNTGKVYTNGVQEFHTYIAYYAHNAIFDVKAPYLQLALEALGEAYLYTGNEKYGIAGAILLDRVADNYPDYDFREMFPKYWSFHGGSPAGKATGRIRESYVAEIFARSYDIFYPAFENPEVIEYLHDKAIYYGMENDKATATKIRQNIEDGICREIFKACQTAQISANFGIHQWTIATAAAALDHKKDTAEMIDWMYATSRSNAYSQNIGGDIERNLVNTVYRDGQNFESPVYNSYTVSELMNAAVVLNRYKQNGGEFDRPSLLEHPKYLAVVNSFSKLTLLRRGTKTVADSGIADLFKHIVDKNAYIDIFNNIKDIEDPEVKEEAIKVAQQLYIQVGKELKNEHYNIWTNNPESLYDEVMDIVEEYGEGDYEKSTIMTGYGIAVLRDGALFDTEGITGIRDTTRDFTLNFSGHYGHQHHDFLDLGMDAYGLGMTTDLGYPEMAVDGDPHTAQWAGTSLAHNTVTVNETQPARPNNTPQEPLHFDAKDTRVKVMDARTPDAYPGTVEEFRRTIVMIDYDDEVSYGVDFFRVDGGKDHLYTFGPNTNSRPTVSENLEGKFVKQEDERQASWIEDNNHYPFSSYAGPTVQFGWDPATGKANEPLHYPNGYTWMFNVERADNPRVNEFWVDYQIEDFRDISRNPNLDVRLRITMLNDFDANEITFASSKPQRIGSNEVLGDLERLLVRRKGTNLDSLFTTVYEPYKAGERYVTDIKSETLTIDKIAGEGTNADTVKAVKVVLNDGRVDYVVYASNKNNTYRITDTETGYDFEFAGFIGVWTVNSDGVNLYSYIHDGSVLGAGENKVESAEAVITGTVTDFQKDLSLDNWVDVTFDRDLTAEEAEDLVDRMMNIDRDSAGNSSYVIEGITMTDAKNARIDLDSITPISKYVDEMDFSKGFIYDIEVGKTFEIPMGYEDNGAPVFDPIGEQTVSAGSMLTLKLNAIPSLGNLTVSYRARTLPRGAAFDETTGTFSWKPTKTQLGKNLVAIDAVDSVGRISTIYFTVEVFGSTSGGSSGGGGGGGGGDVPSDTPADEPTVDPEDPTDEPTDEPGTDTPSETKGFTDLGEHAWAEESINALADAGIIKGTSETTFAPANNITRADYAILLVRAFELESEETENFADVAETDYFARELAVARNTGIVGGIGDNKYAPRNTITRQDMMVILYRALTKQGVELKPIEGIDVSTYADYEDVADYARDAVKALVEAGLVNGKGDKLAGNDKTTRAEVAVLLKRVLDYIK